MNFGFRGGMYFIRRSIGPFLLVASVLAVSACSDSSSDGNGGGGEGEVDTRSFSNVFFFGDSQSDIENYPESIYYQYDPNSGSAYQIATNLYVPVSAPGNSDDFYPLYPDEIEYPQYSSFYNQQRISSNTDSVCSGRVPGNAVCSDRAGESLSWVQFFSYNASRLQFFPDGLSLSSWVASREQALEDDTRKISIDYAWFGSISPPVGCFSSNQSSLDDPLDCLRDPIYLLQQGYRNTQQLDDSEPPVPLLSADAGYLLEDKMPVPTLHQQVEQLFLKDLEENQALVDSDTLYVFFNGANDLARAFFSLLGGQIGIPEFVDDLWRRIPLFMVGSEHSAVEKMIAGLNENGTNSGNIFMFPQYNLGITPNIFYAAGLADQPVVVKKALALALGKLVSIYNYRLEHYTIESAMEHSEYNYFYLGNLYENMRTAAFSDTYEATFGAPCDDDTDLYNSEVIRNGGTTDCRDINNNSYLFWNNSHLASPGQQIIAKSAMDWIEKGETVLQTSQSPEYTEDDLLAALNELLALLGAP